MDRGAPPDFVGVGAQRCGSTWWYELLCEHPRVRRGEKELHFFDRFCAEPMRKEHIREYHDRFRRSRGELMGEWTPRYALDFWTPPLLRQAAPSTRLLLIVRDPIERFASGVIHQSRLTPPRNEVELATIHSEAAMRGAYGAQLGRLLEHFAREQILVLQYERCVADTAGELRRTFRFLEVDDDWVPEEIHMRRGTTSSSEKRALPDAAARALASELRADVAHLCELVPELELERWSDLRRTSEPGDDTALAARDGLERARRTPSGTGEPG